MPLTININNTTAKVFWAFAVFYCVGGLLFSQSKVQTFSNRIDIDGGLDNARVIYERSNEVLIFGSSLISEQNYRRNMFTLKIYNNGDSDYFMCPDSNVHQGTGYFNSIVEIDNKLMLFGFGYSRNHPIINPVIYLSSAIEKDVLCDTLGIKKSEDYGEVNSVKVVDDFIYGLGTVNYQSIGKSGLCQFWLTKLNPHGKIIWEKEFGYPELNQEKGYELGQFLDVLKDGSLIMAGQTSSYGIKSPPNAINTLNIWVIRTDSAGNVIWEQTFGDVGNEEPAGIFQSQDGNIVLGGNYSDTLRRNTGPVWNQYYLVKMDITGQVLWEKRLGGRTETERKLTCIREMPNGDIIASGTYLDRLNFFDSIIYASEIILFDKDGNIKWQRQHALLKSNLSRNLIENIIPTQDGGFIGVGTVIPLGVADTGNQDIWVLKLNEYGCLHADCSDQKMVLADTIEETGYFTQRDDDFVLFPNPASQTVNIHSKEMLNGHVRVYDVRGAMVFEQKLHKTQRIYLDVLHYAKGLYFVHIHDKEQVKALRFLRE